MIKILNFYKKLIRRGTGETCFHTRKINKIVKDIKLSFGVFFDV